MRRTTRLKWTWITSDQIVPVQRHQRRLKGPQARKHGIGNARDLFMTLERSEQFDAVIVADRLHSVKSAIANSAFGRACVKVPKAVYLSLAGFAGTVATLGLISFSVGNVIAHQGYERIAFATPAASSRLIRQNEVAHFGNRVRDAFGIQDSVANEFADWILEASERQGIKPELLASLVVTESSFRKTAQSNVGAIGPAQVRPEYWGEFCGARGQLHDPEQNVYCGAQVLSHMLDRCEGDMNCALAAYNVGPHARDHRNEAANRYVKKIDRYLTSLEAPNAETNPAL